MSHILIPIPYSLVDIIYLLHEVALTTIAENKRVFDRTECFCLTSVGRELLIPHP
jgi:hypothetical protein